MGGMIIGIDPGKSGGIALVDDGKVIAGRRMPLLKHGKRDLVDSKEIETFVRTSTPRHRGFVQCPVVIEQVGAMPGQGGTSMFNFGRHTGAVEAWAIGRGSPVHWVTPAKWKKAMGLTKDKRASLDLARLEFGDDPRWAVLANDGIAEAALLALYWHRHLSTG